MTATSEQSQLHLADELKGVVEGWANTGWPGLTDTTYQLFRYWFNRDESSSQRFHLCQQRAIETIVYCHEILHVKNLKDLFDKVRPDVLNTSQLVVSDVQNVDFPKYCLKMATGTGKTWVLIALLIWQYFNSGKREKPHGAEGESSDWYTNRFLVVAPGLEVLNRLLDAFKGHRNAATGLREIATADYKSSLMMPDSWKSNFNLEIFEPSEVRPNVSPPQGPFVLLTNWQQFALNKGENSLWEELTGPEVGAESRGQFLVDFLSEFSNIVVMNDEAHHVHAAKSKTSEELVWRKFLSVLRKKMLEKHKEMAGIFVQYDFSATPFFGSGTKKIYFSHIVYDYDLISAMHAMLVKQLFLEKKAQLAAEVFDFRAARKKAESGKRQGEITGLSTGQMLMLDIGRKKIESLTKDFRSTGIDKKPVMMVLCEETVVADLVKEHMRHLKDEESYPYDDRKVVAIHMSLKQSEKVDSSRRLDKIDDNTDPLNVVISVLMLREGFDRKNISVLVVLRASESELLLEQIVGRGLRLMFPQRDNEIIWQLKTESLDDIRKNKLPSSSFDCLFIVDHPKFEKFYQRLREQGYLIAIGDSSKVKPTADIVPIDAIPLRLKQYDISWPVQIYEQGAFPDITTIDIKSIPPYSQLDSFSDLRESLGRMMIQDVHYETGKKTKSWKFDTDVFSYTMFLSNAARAVAEEGKTPILSGSLADIAQIIDTYVSTQMFRETVDFEDSKNVLVLNSVVTFNHVIREVRKAILAKLGELKYEQTGVWRKLSEVPRLMMREKNSIETWKTIYPRQSYAGYGGGFERDFMAGILEQSAEVPAYAKLDRRHALLIPYRDEFGVLRDYEVDFLIKTEDSIYLVETKADKDLNDDTVLLKANAAYSWCVNASKVKVPKDVNQAQKFEYLVLPEGIFKANQGLGFSMFTPLCREVRNKMIESFHARPSKS